MSKPEITWHIEYALGSGQYGWNPMVVPIAYESTARSQLAKLREANLHRDDKTRAKTRPCTIWTPDGTWTSYTSAATTYRLVKITREVVDEE